MAKNNISFEEEFPYLSGCKDFEQIRANFSHEEMASIEKSIRLYEETDKIIADDCGELYHVDGEDFFPDAIAWYCGMRATEDFIVDFAESVHESLEDKLQAAVVRASGAQPETTVKTPEHAADR